MAISGWTQDAHNELTNQAVAVFSKIADGTETSITVTGGNTNTRIHIYEYTGNATSSYVDTSNSGSSAAGTTANSASITTTNANDLLFVAFETSTAISSPSFTAPFNILQTDATTMRLFDGDQIVSATGTYSATANWTTSATTRNGIVAYKAAPAVAGSGATILLMGV